MNHFDEMAKAVAGGLTRRETLRRVGGGLVGALVASLSMGKARAQGGGNSVCAHWCDATFPPGPQRGLCKSEAAQGTGPCYTFGPKSPNPCTNCPGTVSNPGHAEPHCGAPGDCCICQVTVEGACFCSEQSCCNCLAAHSVGACSSSLDCPDGWACVASPTCGDICAPACGNAICSFCTDPGCNNF